MRNKTEKELNETIELITKAFDGVQSLSGNKDFRHACKESLESKAIQLENLRSFLRLVKNNN
jgi:hypothetical protein